MKVIVTGGTGFVGRRLKRIKPEWIYLSSKDYDLVCSEDCKRMYTELKPDAVVHLAGKVGGIGANAASPATFYYLNTMINTNIVHQAYLCGVKRVLAALSTCTFPNVVNEYPLCEKDILSGPPAPTNLSYGYSKRSLYIQINSYRKQYGLNYSTFCPTNLYGPEDHFDSEESHFVAALISKVAKATDNDTIELWGTGKPLRQQLYVDDLCEIIPMLLDNHNTDEPIIVAPDENLNINEMAEMLISKTNKNIKIAYNNKLDGQYRKDGSNRRLKEVIGDYNFTRFEDGVYQTYQSYKENL